MDIGPLVEAMDEIVRRAEAQLPHAEQLTAAGAEWERVRGGLADAGQLLAAGAAEVVPFWPDAAGELYAERLRGTAAAVQGWQETVERADAGAVGVALAELIRRTVDAVRALRAEFDAAANEAGAAQLPGIVEEAAALLRELDQAFAEAARRIGGAAGEEADDSAATPMAAAEGTGAQAAAFGAGADAGAPAGGSSTPSIAGPKLAGSAIPSPAGVSALSPAGLAGLPSTGLSGLPSTGLSGLPAAGSPAPSAASLPPAAPGAGAAAALRRVGAIGAGRFGHAPAVRGASMSRPVPAAATPPPPPPTETATTAAGSPAGGSRGIPSTLFPPGGAGQSSGGRPRPGAAETRLGGHTAGAPRSVPGVPSELQGRSAARKPGFIGEPEATAPGPDPLDDELWQVEQPPQSPHGRTAR